MGHSLSHSCLRGSGLTRTQLETVSAYVLAHWPGLTSPNSDLVTMAVCRERRIPCWPTNWGPAIALHSGAAAYLSLLT